MSSLEPPVDEEPVEAPAPVPAAVRAQILRTEHRSLLGTRGTTRAEVMSRITVHLTVTSAALVVLVVLALVAQVSGFGTKSSRARVSPSSDRSRASRAFHSCVRPLGIGRPRSGNHGQTSQAVSTDVGPARSDRRSSTSSDPFTKRRATSERRSPRGRA